MLLSTPKKGSIPPIFAEQNTDRYPEGTQVPVRAVPYSSGQGYGK